MAKCAFMNTRILATARESGRVGFKSSQAWGLVSSMMVRREDDGSV